MADKVYAGFTSAMNPHGGLETTLISLYNSIYHFGGIIVPPGYTDGVCFESRGNPYGPSVTANGEGLTDADIKHARYLGKRVTNIAGKLSRYCF